MDKLITRTMIVMIILLGVVTVNALSEDTQTKIRSTKKGIEYYYTKNGNRMFFTDDARLCGVFSTKEAAEKVKYLVCKEEI